MAGAQWKGKSGKICLLKVGRVQAHRTFRQERSSGTARLGKDLYSSEYYEMICILKEGRDSPGGPVVRKPPSNAGDASSISGQRTKIPCATRQLSLSTTTGEKPACHNEDSVCCN